jgi:hypothetical protein
MGASRNDPLAGEGSLESNFGKNWMAGTREAPLCSLPESWDRISMPYGVGDTTKISRNLGLSQISNSSSLIKSYDDVNKDVTIKKLKEALQ